VLTVKYNSLSNSGTPNPAQELVEACVAQFGDQARLYVRWYDTDGGSRGYSANSLVEVSYAATGVADLRQVQVTFTTGRHHHEADAVGDQHPRRGDRGGGAGGHVGDAVRRRGHRPHQDRGAGFRERRPGPPRDRGQGRRHERQFSNYLVSSDNEIIATMPAGSAGASTVQVTNPTGAGNSFAYTRGAYETGRARPGWTAPAHLSHQPPSPSQETQP
jgi:hypothetical protein